MMWYMPGNALGRDNFIPAYEASCCRTGQLPPARADHVAAMWHYCDCGHWKDILVVHGGSSAAGLLGDVWTYDVDTNR